MSVRRTIGIIDGNQNLGIEISKELANSNCRLLLISNNDENLKVFTKDLIGKHPLADIEFVEGAKEGCWEADLIILAMAEHEQMAIAEKIKEVTIQKTIITISDKKNLNTNLDSFLPYSKLISIYWNYPFKELEIKGSDAQTLDEISHLFQQAGFLMQSHLNAELNQKEFYDR